MGSFNIGIDMNYIIARLESVCWIEFVDYYNLRRPFNQKRISFDLINILFNTMHIKVLEAK